MLGMSSTPCLPPAFERPAARAIGVSFSREILDIGYKAIQLPFADEDVEIARHCSVPDAWEGVNEVA
jgi:hypothetical protein